jgi:Holliday junction resolvase RusA-like endonuclease
VAFHSSHHHRAGCYRYPLALAVPMIELRLDVTPVPKGRPRARRNGHIYTPATTRAYETEVARLASIQMAVAHKRPFALPISVVVGAWLPIPKSFTKAEVRAALAGEIAPNGDIDNFAKSALDALNGIVWTDDRLITQLTATKRYSSAPALTVTVREA